MTLPRKLRQFFALSSAEKAVLIRAAMMMPLIDAELRLRGWRRCHARLAAGFGRHSAPAAVDQPTPQRVAWLVDRAARAVPWPATCLRRSLVLWALLERAGTPGVLRLGVRKAGRSFEIHSWVELDGIPLDEGRDVRSRYAVFDEALAPGDWREA